jgi:hypothetical protein
MVCEAASESCRQWPGAQRSGEAVEQDSGVGAVYFIFRARM